MKKADNSRPFSYIWVMEKQQVFIVTFSSYASYEIRYVCLTFQEAVAYIRANEKDKFDGIKIEIYNIGEDMTPYFDSPKHIYKAQIDNNMNLLSIDKAEENEHIPNRVDCSYGEENIIDLCLFAENKESAQRLLDSLMS